MSGVLAAVHHRYRPALLHSRLAEAALATHVAALRGLPWHRLPLVPVELECTDPHLSALQSSHLPVLLTHGAYPTADEYLESHCRLLRANALTPLCANIAQMVVRTRLGTAASAGRSEGAGAGLTALSRHSGVLPGLASRGLAGAAGAAAHASGAAAEAAAAATPSDAYQLRAYGGVMAYNIEATRRGLVIALSFAPIGKQRAIDWLHSSRFMDGNLVAISLDGTFRGADVLYVTVTAPPEHLESDGCKGRRAAVGADARKWLQKGILHVTPVAQQTEGEYLAFLLRLLRTRKPGYLVESPNFYVASRFALERLQAMHGAAHLPFQDEIVFCRLPAHSHAYSAAAVATACISGSGRVGAPATPGALAEALSGSGRTVAGHMPEYLARPGTLLDWGRLLQPSANPSRGAASFGAAAAPEHRAPLVISEREALPPADRATFSPLRHVALLPADVRARTLLDPSQQAAVQLALSSRVAVIQGPPGTG